MSCDGCKNYEYCYSADKELDVNDIVYKVQPLKGVVQYKVSDVYCKEGDTYIKLVNNRGSVAITETLSIQSAKAQLGVSLFKRYRDALNVKF